MVQRHQRECLGCSPAEINAITINYRRAGGKTIILVVPVLVSLERKLPKNTAGARIQPDCNSFTGFLVGAQ